MYVKQDKLIITFNASFILNKSTTNKGLFCNVDAITIAIAMSYIAVNNLQQKIYQMWTNTNKFIRN